MRTSQPLFSSMPPGYSGPPPEPPKREANRAPDRAPPGQPEVLEDIPFDVSDKPRITHTAPLGSNAQHAEGEGIAEQQPAGAKIRTFDQRLGGAKHEDSWNRTPNVTGTGAIHVKSFHCKLTGDSLDFLDQQINEWLDEHPQYEVKFVTTGIGTWSGKLKEPNLIVNVWV